VIAIPLIVWVMRSFYESIPDELVDAATPGGAWRRSQLRRIAIPLAAPDLGVAAILSIVACLNDFVFPFLQGQRPTVRELSCGAIY
jgi:multiple sugar transport system permease protein